MSGITQACRHKQFCADLPASPHCGMIFLTCLRRILSIGLRLCLLLLCSIALFGCQLAGRRDTSQDIVQVQNPCLALVLPASGPYATIAGKIRKGADLGIAELGKKGMQVQLKHIDSNAANWLAQLASLPPAYAVIGGPLQEKNYLELRKAGQLEQRVFFAFLPTLAKGDEGKAAWRFFPSQQDQIDALINFTTDQLNIRTYGAFYPNDNYGQRMTALLEQGLTRRQMPLIRAAYNPAAPAAMTAAARPLLNPHTGPDGKQPVPQTAFEALFVPDSWKRMGQVTSSLWENGEDRLVLLGPSLWEQGLQGKTPGPRSSLAVFPTPYSSGHAPAIVRKNGNDLWTAMGYDFVNFAATLALGQRPASPAVITTLAQAAAPAVKALAPMHWDNAGLGHEKLYIFQVGSNGITPVNVENFRKTRQSVAERAALRMQGFGHINPDTGEVLERQPEIALPPEGMPAAASPQAPVHETMPQPAPQPVSSHAPAVSTPATPAPARPTPIPSSASQPASLPPQQGIMRATPRSSYKLSLPVRQ